MVKSNELARIFWPSNISRGLHSGVILGWRNSERDYVVLTVLRNVEIHNVAFALRTGALFRGSAHPTSRILKLCGGSQPQALGEVNPSTCPTVFNPSHIVMYTHPKQKVPELFCPQEETITVQVILFDQPNPARMQFLSLSPMSLALADKSESAVNLEILDRNDEDEAKRRKQRAALVEKLKQHTVISHPATKKELCLPMIVDQINCSFELAELMQRNVGLVGHRARRALSVSEIVAESASTLWELVLYGLWQILMLWIYPQVVRLSIFGLVAQRVAVEFVLRILDLRPFIHRDDSWKDISATASQIDIRLQQFCYWPIQYLTLRKRKEDWKSVTDSHPEYIRFYNSLWLVANDIIIGIALGSYMRENAQLVAEQLDKVLTDWSIDGLQRMITWLMDWPAGLKLNNELAVFLGDLFLWVIRYWAGYMGMLRPYFPQLIYLIGCSAYAGATLPMSIFSDLVSILTLHIYSFYVASARIYHWQLTIIVSLFHLFRGKKRNVLRNRIDSCDYDLDQLLLGTILFTLLFFLLPTVFVFYLTFASARMVIITIKAALDTQLAFLNHFPLFALMLRVKDSRRLPGGIYFALQSTPSTSAPLSPPQIRPAVPSAATSHIIVRSIPLPLQHMFHEYFQLGDQIRSHYLLPGVFLRLVTGRFVPPMHRKNLYQLQYSMLPAERVGVTDLWKRLQEATVEAEQARKEEKLVRKSSLKAFGNGSIRTSSRMRKNSWEMTRPRRGN